MIKFDNIEQFWSTGITKNMVSVQDVIDVLSALTPPEGRTLSNIPFGFINTKGRPVILFDEDKKSILSFGITRAFPVLLDFKRKGAVVVPNTDDLIKEKEALEKENMKLKNKLSEISEISKLCLNM